MQPFEKIKEYSKAVCGQIRWKKAHAVISEEIENHLTDQRNAYISDGTDEAAATDKALKQMGDPVTVGTQLDRTHRPKPQWGMLGLVLVIAFIGVFLNVISGTFWGGSVLEYTLYCSLSALIGIAVLVAFYFIDFTWIGKYPRILYFLLLILITIKFVVTLINPNAGMIILPLLFPLGFAGLVYSARNKGWRGVLLCSAAFLIPAAMLLILCYQSTFLLFAVSSLVIICLAIFKGWFNVKIRRRWLFFSLLSVIISLLAMAYMAVGESIKAALAVIDPSYVEVTYTNNSILLASSHLFGRGTLPGGDLPYIDMIGRSLTSLIFDIGWIPSMLIISVLFFFIVQSFRLCFKQKNSLGLFVSVSVMITFTVQTISYVLANLGVEWLAPMSLPLIHQYGWDSYINWALIGMMLSVFRTGHVIKDNTLLAARNRLISFRNGKLGFSLGKK